MSDQINLQLTGVSGYIGFKTLKIALERGHRVRGVVRSGSSASDIEAKSDLIANAKSSGQLEWAIVPDFQADGAISEILTGITAIVHLASPLAIEVSLRCSATRTSTRLTPCILQTTDFDKDIVQPAIDILTRVLEAAANAEKVRRVVITSSCNTLHRFPPSNLLNGSRRHSHSLRVEFRPR